ncbi:hypothetical protein C5167_044606 [Papaver somniferum]|uniref:Uncharacterized protein n=1 Tax=Papaver somniferum TaxID=3469 RepID=A0A4Y7LAI7_PAPSO|nr:uncharacterized protein LOC113317850 [Papaver somniferum]RZC82017.1 hypothetical protein C5167_044606 [Papaver somniferum]
MAPRNSSSLVLAGFLLVVLFTIHFETTYAQTFGEVCTKKGGVVKVLKGCDKCGIEQCQGAFECAFGTVLVKLKDLQTTGVCILDKKEPLLGGKCNCCCAEPKPPKP